jgi:hypothetical protein
MSEGLDRQTYMEFQVNVYKNLIKAVMRKLNLKINIVYWRKA